MNNMKIAILASGGNSPGMNNIIVGLVKAARFHNIEPWLIYDGYDGILKNQFVLADIRNLEQFITRGNAIIGSSRSKTFYDINTKQQAVKVLKEKEIEVLIVIGGDGSYNGAAQLSKLGMKVMCLPGTIDNDIASTSTTIGFFTCLNTIVNHIDALRDSFESHCGICFVEVMGRGHSDLAVRSGIATCAEAIITSKNILLAKDFIKIANDTWKNGKRSCIFVITEQIYGMENYPPLTQIAKQVEQATGRTTRINIIGHAQRGGVVTAIDRYWAVVMATHCIECIVAGRFNRAIGEIERKVVDIDINEALQIPSKEDATKLVDKFEQINNF